MTSCRLVEFVINTIPVRKFQDFLIRRHVQRCPRCQTRLVSREAVRLGMTNEEDIGANESFFRAVAARVARGRTTRALGRVSPLPFGRWAVATGLLLTAGAVLWLVLAQGDGPVRVISDESEKFRINYFNVDGAAANPLVIQPRDSDLVIIWADRDLGSLDRKGEPGGRP